MVVSNTWDLQGTVLAQVLFTLYTEVFKCKSDSCHIQRYTDGKATVVCIRNGQKGDYMDLILAFSDWSSMNCLILNITKAKEMAVDFRRSKFPIQPFNIQEEDIEVVQTNWTDLQNRDVLYRKGKAGSFSSTLLTFVVKCCLCFIYRSSSYPGATNLDGR